MYKVMLIYPPGKAYQRSEDRAQCNLEESAVVTVHACNDLGYAAQILRNRHYDVMLRDYQTEKTDSEQIREEIMSYLPDILVISTTNGAILQDIAFVNWMTEFHSCRMILKGAIFFDTPDAVLETLDLRNVDCLIGTEMDTVIGQIADCMTQNAQAMKEIPGIFYKEKGVFQRTAFDTWCTQLDEIPFPARDLMKNKLYVRPDTAEPMATIQVSRGCPSRCSYCLTPVISGRKVRKRSVENVYAEILECYDRYGIRNFFFKADTFTIDEAWAMALCDRIIQSPLHGKIAFTVNSRANPNSRELYEKLKEAGCFTIAVGFESGSDDTLRRIKKGTTRQDNLQTARLLKEIGIPIFGFFMIGFPWETEADIRQTLSFMLEIDPDFVEVHIAMPYYGTELYRQCRAYNTISDTAWGSDYFSPNTVGTAAVPMGQIKKIRNRYLLRFYLRPRYIARKLFGSLTKPVVVKNYIKHGFILLKTIFIKPKNR